MGLTNILHHFKTNIAGIVSKETGTASVGD